jgi:hypothetical protein
MSPPAANPPGVIIWVTDRKDMESSGESLFSLSVSSRQKIPRVFQSSHDDYSIDFVVDHMIEKRQLHFQVYENKEKEFINLEMWSIDGYFSHAHTQASPANLRLCVSVGPTSGGQK